MTAPGRIPHLSALALAWLGLGCQTPSGASGGPVVQAPLAASPAPAPAAVPAPPPPAEPTPPRLAAHGSCASTDAPEGSVCIDLETREIRHEKLMFAIDKGDVEPESFATLDALAELILAHPEIERIEIAGHHASHSQEHR